MSVYPYKADETIRVKSWTIRFFKADRLASCHRDGTNVTYVITPTTDTINHLPQYIITELERRLFLREWKAKKIRESITRLNQISRKLEKSL